MQKIWRETNTTVEEKSKTEERLKAAKIQETEVCQERKYFQNNRHAHENKEIRNSIDFLASTDENLLESESEMNDVKSADRNEIKMSTKVAKETRVWRGKSKWNKKQKILRRGVKKTNQNPKTRNNRHERTATGRNNYENQQTNKRQQV